MQRLLPQISSQQILAEIASAVSTHSASSHDMILPTDVEIERRLG
jgi:hypothetical protein